MASTTTANALLPLHQGPRVILYHQTHHGPNNGPPISLLPLITQNTGITHVIIAAIHINADPTALTLNDDPPTAPKFAPLWSEVATLQTHGVKVLGMLGGAAKGSFARLDTDDATRFESYYAPLHALIRAQRLDGLDLDIEEATSLKGTIRLIDRLHADFGAEFLVTLAPVATALLAGRQPHLSGPDFDYHELEARRGHAIAWYNVQFYNGWGDASTTFWYEVICEAGGWPARRVVLGLLTSPANGGSGFVELQRVRDVLRTLRARHGVEFGGVMGWEFFNALPGGLERPWEWASAMASVVRGVNAPAETLEGREFQGLLSLPAHPFSAESVKTLQALGFGRQQAVAALNATEGNVEYAAGLLFQE
nr:acidic endochitinase [Quercus suber]